MNTAGIVLSGGRGSRMNSAVKKQYLILGGKPLIWYSLNAFEQCPQIKEIVLVCGRGETDWCREEIVQRYGFQKVTHITEGGQERYHSVYEGLKSLTDCDCVMIHDGARPFLDQKILERLLGELDRGNSCVAGMPVKDTIKLANVGGIVETTLPREKLWTVQTPQCFSYPLIRAAYDRMIRAEQEDGLQEKITDDAMVAETFAGTPVKLVEGSYFNIKITTPEDLVLAEAILQHRQG